MVINSLRAFRHYVLVGGAPRPGGCWSDFDLLTDNQAITWLKTHKHLNMMYVRWLDEIEDFLFKFDVTHQVAPARCMQPYESAVVPWLHRLRRPRGIDRRIRRGESTGTLFHPSAATLPPRWCSQPSAPDGRHSCARRKFHKYSGGWTRFPTHNPPRGWGKSPQVLVCSSHSPVRSFR